MDRHRHEPQAGEGGRMSDGVGLGVFMVLALLFAVGGIALIAMI